MRQRCPFEHSHTVDHPDELRSTVSDALDIMSGLLCHPELIRRFADIAA
jgi:hypothetical protein